MELLKGPVLLVLVHIRQLLCSCATIRNDINQRVKLSARNSSSRGAMRPSNFSRVDLGADDDDELDYGSAGPSNPSPHTPSRSGPPPPPRHHTHDPRSTSRLSSIYHDLDSTSQSRGPSSRPTPTSYRRPSGPTPSPEPDKDVLAYIAAQRQHDTSTLDAEAQRELELSEQLKREKFQHGASKVKSRAQKEREAEEKKKKQAEEDAKAAYYEFVAAMDGDTDDHRRKARDTGTGFVGSGGKAYIGSRAAEHAPTKRTTGAFGDEEDQEGEGEIVSPTRKDTAPKRKRVAMDSFLTELQVTQAERESRLSTLASSTNTSISTLLAHETISKTGSRDLNSDPLTTNICILSLPPNVDERAMGEFFCAWGDVATVKIMWPRGEQRERVGGLTGFVAYMTRKDAEFAFKEADGVIWGGTRVKMSWGKAMPLPSRAMYPASTEKRHHVQEDEGAKVAKAGKSGIPKLTIRHRRSDRGGDKVEEELKSKVEQEVGETTRLFIETVASRIRGNGANFEAVLREREADNPKFAFLHETDSNLHHYFRFCLDPSHVPPTMGEGAEFSDQGSDELYSTDSGEDSETDRISHHRNPSGTRLGLLARRRFLSMLRGLTLRRERIARITAFALDHSSSHSTVVSILVSSLLRPFTPIPRKLARLYALSDLLHNSGAPISNAWRYRAEIETKLPLVFAHWGQVVRSFEGRMKREEVRAKVLGVLQVWEGWIVVGPHVLERVRRVFEHPPVTFAKTQEIEEVEDMDGEALDSTSLKPPAPASHKVEADAEEEEDLDGEAL